MKKLVLVSLCLLIAAISIEVCEAKTIKEEMTTIRINLGKSFNKVVNLLKDQIRPQDEKIKAQKVEIKNLFDTAQHIKDRVVAGEINPTLLQHGTQFMQNCGASEEMYWNGSSWQCRGITAEIACEPTKGEVINSGVCVQQGAYSSEIQGWEDCRGNIGERYTSTACMFENSKDGSKIQVSDAKCGTLKKYKQACGSKGAQSTCACPEGTEYYYGPDNSGNIIEACKTAPINYISKPRKFNANFCTDHFTKLRMIVIPSNNKTYLQLILEGQDPGGGTDGRCGFKHFTKDQLESWGFVEKGMKEPVGNGKSKNAFNSRHPGAYYNLGRIEIFDHPESVDIDEFTYTFRSAGSGCTTITDGRGVGNRSFGGKPDQWKVYDRVYDGYSLTFCPGNSAQNVKVSVTITGVYGHAKEIAYEPLPVCEQNITENSSSITK
jgi:hypothetical protein